MSEILTQKRNLGRIFLSCFFWLLLLVPVASYLIDEIFIDPFPKSLWHFRISHTEALIHVKADLTIDGEPLILERTIRCFDPVDYHYFPGAARRGDVMSSNGQAGDTLAATTSKGRLFAINVPDACGAFKLNLGKKLILSRGDIETPVLFEIHGGKAATQIDAYIARDLLRTGYHGVQLNELIVARGKGPLKEDWTDYDWFGPPNWYRGYSSNDRSNREVSSAYFSFKVDAQKFLEVEDFFKQPNNNALQDENKIRSLFLEHSGSDDRALSSYNPFSQFQNHVLNVFDMDYLDSSLILKPPSKQSAQTGYYWFLQQIFPCLPQDNPPKRFACNPALNGVISFIPYIFRLKSRDIVFELNGQQFKNDDHLRYQFISGEKAVYGFERTGATLGREK